MPMTPDVRTLWEQLRGFDFDGGPAAFTFRDRLAREQAWSARYATRVLDEYRRFLLLSAIAGHPVTPSEAVDDAWHLHLTYTRSYWDDLCGRVLPRPLHHGPTRGGAAEDAKFQDWYTRTLASYQRVFDAEPPLDIWPAPATRFADARRFARVDTSAVWLVPKPTWWPPRRAVAATLSLLAAGLASACTGDNALGAGIFALASIGVVSYLVLWNASRPPEAHVRRPRREDHGGSSGCGSASSHASNGGSGTDCGNGSSAGSDCGDGGSSSGCGGGGCGGGGGD